MNTKTWIVSFVIVASLYNIAFSHFMPPSYLPTDRLIANTEAYINRNPQKPEGYYILARIHYLSFINKASAVPGYENNEPLPSVIPYWQYATDYEYAMRYQHAQQLLLADWGYSSIDEIPRDQRSAFDQAVFAKEAELGDQGWKPDHLNNAQVLAHAILAHINFEKAMDVDPENGLYFLGLASLLEQYQEYVEKANLPDYLPQLGSVTVPRLRILYYLAYRLSVDKDMTWEYIPIGGLRSLVGYEAGQAYLRLAKEKPALPETNAIKQVTQNLNRLDTLPWGPITPIIFSLQRHTSVSDLLDTKTKVSFDLDGNGSTENWPWLKPDTGLLVWDPGQTGKINSGRQLFGTSTWWLLFPNGYFALSSLDDNQDGSLTQGELQGISVWFDTNSNGQSEPGEVTPIQTLGITAIQTRITGHSLGMPMHPQGIRLRNGQSVPTYDWLTSR
jgi:hypothetical protein